MWNAMARGKSNLRSVWLQVVAELGQGNITEQYIKQDGFHVDGLCEGDAITINPSHQTVDTVIHEILHRVYPTRTERSIRRTTTILRKTLTDDEVQWIYAEYQKRKRTVQRPRRADV